MRAMRTIGTPVHEETKTRKTESRWPFLQAADGIPRGRDDSRGRRQVGREPARQADVGGSHPATRESGLVSKGPSKTNFASAIEKGEHDGCQSVGPAGRSLCNHRGAGKPQASPAARTGRISRGTRRRSPEGGIKAPRHRAIMIRDKRPSAGLGDSPHDHAMTIANEILDLLRRKRRLRLTAIDIAEILYWDDKTYQQRVKADCLTLYEQDRLARDGSGRPTDPYVYSLSPAERRSFSP
jgi:hypothetical protein